MIYAIIIWTSILVTTLWIFSRLYRCFRNVDAMLHLKVSHVTIKQWNSRRSVLTSLIVIFAWWMSFMLIESFRHAYGDIQPMYSQLIPLMVVPFSIIMLYQMTYLQSSKKYKISIHAISSTMERTLYLMISLLYALLISYGIEAYVMLMA